MYIHDLCMTLIFDLCVMAGVSLVRFTHNFYLVILPVNFKKCWKLGKLIFESHLFMRKLESDVEGSWKKFIVLTATDSFVAIKRKYCV